MKVTKVDCSRGAPMGRYENHVKPTGRTVLLAQVPMMADGAYDAGGAYWGIGAPIYCACEMGMEGYVEYVRAFSRKEAAEKLGITELLWRRV